VVLHQQETFDNTRAKLRRTHMRTGIIERTTDRQGRLRAFRSEISGVEKLLESTRGRLSPDAEDDHVSVEAQL
jgi:hypothetical protein